MSDDFYAILGVADDASPADIKQAYRALARKYHPDRNPGDETATDRFKDAAEAYRVLGDVDLRAQYDAYRSGGNGGGSHGIPHAATEATGDVLDDLFGTSREKQRREKNQQRVRRERTPPPAPPPRREPTERGDDLRYDLEIDFEESVQGTEHVIYVPGEAACRSCRGTGAAPGSAPVLCSRCNGRGAVREQQGFFDTTRRCSDCGGSGKLAARSCGACEGSGVEIAERPVTVDVPPGVTTGTRLRVRGVGRSGGGGGPTGDLIVVVTVRPHPFFERDGADLLVEVPVSMTTAALGGQIEIPTLDGPMRMRLPPGSQNGRMFRLQGKGLPRPDGRGVGDQRVRIAVQTPEQMTDAMRELLEEYAELEDELEPSGAVRDFRHTMKRYYAHRR